MKHKRLLSSSSTAFLQQKLQLRAPYVAPLNILQVGGCCGCGRWARGRGYVFMWAPLNLQDVEWSSAREGCQPPTPTPSAPPTPSPNGQPQTPAPCDQPINTPIPHAPPPFRQVYSLKILRAIEAGTPPEELAAKHVGPTDDPSAGWVGGVCVGGGSAGGGDKALFCHGGWLVVWGATITGARCKFP